MILLFSILEVRFSRSLYLDGPLRRSTEMVHWYCPLGRSKRTVYWNDPLGRSTGALRDGPRPRRTGDRPGVRTSIEKVISFEIQRCIQKMTYFDLKTSRKTEKLVYDEILWCLNVWRYTKRT